MYKRENGMEVCKSFSLGIIFCCVLSSSLCFAQDSDDKPQKNDEAAAAGPAQKIDMKKQTFRVLLSTGEFYTGKVDGVKNDEILFTKESYCPAGSQTRKLKSEKGKVKILIKNVVDISPLEEGKDPMSVPNNLEHYIKNGKLMLDSNQPQLAELLFRLGIYYVPKQGATAVKEIYKEAGKDLPDSLTADKVKEFWQYRMPNPEEVLTAIDWSIESAKAMKKLAPSTHIIETEHFIICSAWAKSDDKALKTIYEKLYKALCNQFNIDKDENVWVGKLPVFAFWKKNEFMSFMAGPLEIDGPLERIGGLCGTRGSKSGMVTFVCLGPVDVGGDKSKSKTWFFELLVHETTHGFVGRYINSTNIPNWVNEGLAETMASTLVPHCGAVEKFKQASQGIGQGQSPKGIFDCQNIPLNAFSYGAAQSAVRYLISVDRRKFIKFVTLLKEGKSDSNALESAYGFDRNKMVTQWQKSLARKSR